VTLIFIYGPPAAGKLTVAKELARRTGFPLFHNHVAFDLASSLFRFGTRGHQRVVDAVRLAVFEIAASEELEGLIFTFVYGSEVDNPFVEQVLHAVESRGGRVAFVRLYCPPAVLEERVVAAERRQHGKLVDPQSLRELLRKYDLFAPVPFRKSLTLDSSRIPPDQATAEIMAHLEK
jgi:hypothetical protein